MKQIQLKKNEIYTVLFVDCLPRIIDVAGKKQLPLHIKQRQNLCRNRLFQVRTIKFSVISQCNANKTNPSVDTLTSQKNKQTTKHDWPRFVLQLNQLKLKVRSSTYDMNISLLILYWEDCRANSTFCYKSVARLLKSSEVNWKMCS